MATGGTGAGRCTATTTSITSSARFEDEATERGWPQPVVYAHEPSPTTSVAERTLGWNTAINSASSPSPSTRSPGRPTRYPDVTYREHLTFTQGGLTFELHHARGETDDATWTFVPAGLHPGDLFIWAVPNAGTRRRCSASPATGRRRCGRWPGAAPRSCCAGTACRSSADRSAEALTDTADVLETIEAQTLVLMNRGVPLDRVLRGRGPRTAAPAAVPPAGVRPPPVPRAQRLAPLRRWYDGEPDNLLPPRAPSRRGSG